MCLRDYDRFPPLHRHFSTVDLRLNRWKLETMKKKGCDREEYLDGRFACFANLETKYNSSTHVTLIALRLSLFSLPEVCKSIFNQSSSRP